MQSYSLPAVIFLFTAVICIALLCWRKSAARSKQNQEQIERKQKEDALDRALSNGARRSDSAQVPMEVHYSADTQRESGSMLRLTEQAESVTKEYLFRRTEIFYVGEEYGHAAVFRERGQNKLHCEFFPYQNGTYVRLCGRAECRLIRGKQTARITSKAICLRTRDKIETQAGVFLVELI